jgi:hypothetical protein
MLIHLTDRSQNSQFHDRYFAGVDFDLSQCLFVFSYNDESKIHPVLQRSYAGHPVQWIQCCREDDHPHPVCLARRSWIASS